MKAFQRAKGRAVKVLEAHPLGYLLGGLLLERFDFLLPHEVDYFGFPILARSGFATGGCILDLGANRGHSARAFLRLLPGVRVHSVEANPIHRKRLERIRSKVGIRFSFTISAMSDFSGRTLTLFTPRYGPIRLHSATSVFRGEAIRAFEAAFPALGRRCAVEVCEVESITGDELDLDVDFAKLDLQGSELAALRGMTRTIERGRPVLLVERSVSHQEVGRFLLGLAYRPWRFDVETGRFREGIGSFDSHHCNVFFVPVEKAPRLPV